MYRLYQSKKYIWWDSIDRVDVPYAFNSINFEWEEIDTNCIYFEKWNEGKIIVKTNDITYFKMEKDNNTTYWFVDKVNKVLKEGYEIQVKLDYWATFGKQALNAIINYELDPLIERISISNKFYRQGDGTVASRLNLLFSQYDELVDDIEISDYTVSVERSQLSAVGNIDILWENKINGLIRFTDQSQSNGALNLWPDGLYAVFINKNTNLYDIFPIIADIEPTGYRIVNRQDESFIGDIHNTYDNIMSHLVNTDTSDYTTNGFVGIFKGPILPPIEPKSRWKHAWSTKHNVRKNFIFTSINIVYGRQGFIEFPISKDWAEYRVPFIDNMIKLHNKYLWGTNELSGKSVLFGKWYYLNFIDGFFLSNPNPYKGLEYSIYFGSSLPSGTQDYINKIKIAKQNYDSGLSSALIGGVGSAVGVAATAAVNPILGAVSGVTAGVSLMSSLIQNGQNYKRAIAGAHPTFINSNTKDVQWHWLTNNLKWSLFLNAEGFAKQSLIKFTPSDFYQKQIKQLYDLYGYNIKTIFSIKNMFALLDTYFTRRLYIKINEGWLSTHIRSIFKNTFPKENVEVLKEIASMFTNGLRLWLTPEPTYNTLED